MIIGLCGYKSSGKDTVAAYLVKNYQFEIRSFAQPLKNAVANLFEAEYAEIDGMKNNPLIVVVYGGYDDETGLVNPYTRPLNFRQFLQRFGNECLRETFGDNILVDKALPLDGFYAGRSIVVSDVRFQNEIDRIHALDGVVIEVDREAPSEKDHHRSEQIHKLSAIDFTIENYGTLENLYKAIDFGLSEWQIT